MPRQSFTHFIHLGHKSNTQPLYIIIIMKYNCFWNLFRAVRRFREQVEAVVQPFCEENGVTQAQMKVLMTLDASGPQTTTALAGACGMAVANCSVLCKKLDGMGLVQRRRGPADERQVLVCLSATGAALAAEGRELFTDVFRRADVDCAAQKTEEDIRCMVDCLNGVSARLEEYNKKKSRKTGTDGLASVPKKAHAANHTGAANPADIRRNA